MRFITSSRIRRKFPTFIASMLAKEAPMEEACAVFFSGRYVGVLKPAEKDLPITKEYVVSSIAKQRVTREDKDNPFYPMLDTCQLYKHADLADNPYYKNIKLGEYRVGNFHTDKVEDVQYEIFQNGIQKVMNVDGIDIYVPNIGVWVDKPEPFYVLRDNANNVWMSISFSEINTMKEPIEKAHGRCLVLGCGLGYYTYMIARKPEVESITVIENSLDMIALFNEVILPQFGELKDKVKIIHSDAFSYLEKVAEGQYHFCFADIWRNLWDSYPYFKMKKVCGNTYRGMQMEYWIEDAFIGDIFVKIRQYITAHFLIEEKMDTDGFVVTELAELKTKKDNGYTIAEKMLENVVIRSMEDIQQYFSYENIKKLFLEHYAEYIVDIADNWYDRYREYQEEAKEAFLQGQKNTQ